MSKIVVSYRRSDSQAIAGRIVDRLIAQFGDQAGRRRIAPIRIRLAAGMPPSPIWQASRVGSPCAPPGRLKATIETPGREHYLDWACRRASAPSADDQP